MLRNANKYYKCIELLSNENEQSSKCGKTVMQFVIKLKISFAKLCVTPSQATGKPRSVSRSLDDWHNRAKAVNFS